MNPADRFPVHSRSYKHKKTGKQITIHYNMTMIGLHKNGIKLSEYIPGMPIRDTK